jgi:hypothetical protein
MTNFSLIRRNALNHWKTRTGRVFKISDNLTDSFECSWQGNAENFGYKHISIFCSIGQFGSHLTDLFRDYRFDKYEFDQSEVINELIFRYYSRILLIVSEILTDFQDLYILADDKLTTKQLGGLSGAELKEKHNIARTKLANDSIKIKELLEFINKICKHKTSNFHICNNHIEFLFEDFHTDIKAKRKKVELGNIKSFTSYDSTTFKKHKKPNYIVLPKFEYIIDIIIGGYIVLDELFGSDITKFEFICQHFENK